jgi:hypothetical protein
MANRRRCFTLDDEFWKEFDRLAKQEEVSATDLLEVLVDDYVWQKAGRAPKDRQEFLEARYKELVDLQDDLKSSLDKPGYATLFGTLIKELNKTHDELAVIYERKASEMERTRSSSSLLVQLLGLVEALPPDQVEQLRAACDKRLGGPPLVLVPKEETG